MADYHREMDIAVPADEAFAFVSDLNNLPRFVPTTRSAHADDKGHVQIDGEADGEPYHDEGHIHVDPDQRLMRWGSGESAYRGELYVSETGGQAHVEINLHFRDDDGEVPEPRQVEQSLDRSLERLREELMRH
jgi:hypothetical protein